MTDEEGDFGPFVEHLLSQGYSRNECPGHCPYKAEEHEHLHSPGNPASIGTPPVDFILWGDGTSTRHDLTRPASYVPVPVRDEIGAVLRRAVDDAAAVVLAPPAYSAWTGRTAGKPARPASCYQAGAGFTVHVRPGCRCAR